MDEDEPNSECPRCGMPCRFRVVMSFVPPDHTHWDCPICGQLYESDSDGRTFDVPSPRTATPKETDS